MNGHSDSEHRPWQSRTDEMIQKPRHCPGSHHFSRRPRANIISGSRWWSEALCPCRKIARGKSIKASKVRWIPSSSFLLKIQRAVTDKSHLLIFFMSYNSLCLGFSAFIFTSPQFISCQWCCGQVMCNVAVQSDTVKWSEIKGDASDCNAVHLIGLFVFRKKTKA